MDSSSAVNTHLRNTSYRGNIPLYILLDLSLCANAIRLYGLVEQMQCARYGRIARFSNKYISQALGIDVRQVQNISKKLKDKGYLIRTQIGPNKWEWKTGIGQVIQDENDENEENMNEYDPPHGENGGAIPEHGGVQSDYTGGCNENAPINTSNIKHLNINTTTKNNITNEEIARASNTSSNQSPTTPPPKESGGGGVGSGFIISEEIDNELLGYNRSFIMHAKDNREFLMWCKYSLDNKVNAENLDSKVKVLKSWIKNGGLKKPNGYGEPKSSSGYAVKRSQNDSEMHNKAAYADAKEVIAKRDAGQIAGNPEVARMHLDEMKRKMGLLMAPLLEKTIVNLGEC